MVTPTTCFLCFKTSREWGKKPPPPDANVNHLTFLLNMALELPSAYEDNSRTKINTRQFLSFCPTCADKLLRLEEVTIDLAELEKKFKRTAAELESQFRKSWTRSREERETGGDSDYYSESYATHKYRKERVEELKTRTLQEVSIGVQERKNGYRIQRPRQYGRISSSNNEEEEGDEKGSDRRVGAKVQKPQGRNSGEQPPPKVRRKSAASVVHNVTPSPPPKVSPPQPPSTGMAVVPVNMVSTSSTPTTIVDSRGRESLNSPRAVENRAATITAVSNTPDPHADSRSVVIEGKSLFINIPGSNGESQLPNFEPVRVETHLPMRRERIPNLQRSVFSSLLCDNCGGFGHAALECRRPFRPSVQPLTIGSPSPSLARSTIIQSRPTSSPTLVRPTISQPRTSGSPSLARPSIIQHHTTTCHPPGLARSPFQHRNISQGFMPYPHFLNPMHPVVVRSRGEPLNSIFTRLENDSYTWRRMSDGRVVNPKPIQSFCIPMQMETNSTMRNAVVPSPSVAPQMNSNNIVVPIQSQPPPPAIQQSQNTLNVIERIGNNQTVSIPPNNHNLTANLKQCVNLPATGPKSQSGIQKQSNAVDPALIASKQKQTMTAKPKPNLQLKSSTNAGSNRPNPAKRYYVSRDIIRKTGQSRGRGQGQIRRRIPRLIRPPVERNVQTKEIEALASMTINSDDSESQTMNDTPTVRNEESPISELVGDIDLRTMTTTRNQMQMPVQYSSSSSRSSSASSAISDESGSCSFDPNIRIKIEPGSEEVQVQVAGFGRSERLPTPTVASALGREALPEAEDENSIQSLTKLKEELERKLDMLSRRRAELVSDYVSVDTVDAPSSTQSQNLATPQFRIDNGPAMRESPRPERRCSIGFSQFLQGEPQPMNSTTTTNSGLGDLASKLAESKSKVSSNNANRNAVEPRRPTTAPPVFTIHRNESDNNGITPRPRPRIHDVTPLEVNIPPCPSSFFQHDDRAVQVNGVREKTLAEDSKRNATPKNNSKVGLLGGITPLQGVSDSHDSPAGNKVRVGETTPKAQSLSRSVGNGKCEQSYKLPSKQGVQCSPGYEFGPLALIDDPVWVKRPEERLAGTPSSSSKSIPKPAVHTGDGVVAGIAHGNSIPRTPLEMATASIDRLLGRGPSSFTMSSVVRCSRCGRRGHFSRYCKNFSGYWWNANGGSRK